MKILLLLIFSFSFCEDKNETKEIPRLDLRDGVKFNLNLKSDLIVKDKTDGFGVLSEAHIEKIKLIKRPKNKLSAMSLTRAVSCFLMASYIISFI